MLPCAKLIIIFEINKKNGRNKQKKLEKQSKIEDILKKKSIFLA